MPRDLTEPSCNWIHLDMKGALPTEAVLLQWVDYLAELGFGGIVWEYDDRIPWKAWPGTFRPGYDMDAWQRIWARCRKHGLVVVPLIQTLGHLEWLLKHDAHAHLAEADNVGQICPTMPGTRDRLKAWIDEVIELHPDAPYIHIGADEAGALGRCPRCAAVAECSPHGKLAVFLEHVAELSQHVISRGKRPMIWADMPRKEGRLELAGLLPEATVLVDWLYSGPGPFESTQKLLTTGYEVWGASAIRKSYPRKDVVGPIGATIANVTGWNEVARTTNITGVIHTFWGRSMSLALHYGLWEAWLPAFIAAGDPQRWANNPLEPAVKVLDDAMADPTGQRLEPAAQQLEAMHVEDPREQRCLRWWILSLRHRALLLKTCELAVDYFGYEQQQHFVGIRKKHVRDYHRNRLEHLEKLDAWEQQARAVWAQCGLSEVDADEFFASRVSNLRRLLDPAWTAELMP